MKHLFPAGKLSRALASAVILTTALFFVPVASAGQHSLRYEWSAAPGGPFTPVPPEMIRVNADGTATILTNEDDPRAFYRLQFATGGGGGAGIGEAGPTVPVMPLSSLPPETVERLTRFIATIGEGDSPEAADWKNVSISPFVTPVVTLDNETGVPDLVEVKIIGKCDEEPGPGDIFLRGEGKRRSADRGFIMASLSRKLPPIVGYATDGTTPCEAVLSNCHHKPIACIRRFGPMFLAAEDADGNLLGHEGLFPIAYPEDAYKEYSRPIKYEWDSERGENPPMPEAPARFEPLQLENYRQLREVLRSSPRLSQRRKQREALIEFDWQVIDGTAPTLTVTAGQTKAFLETETFSSIGPMDEDEARIAEVSINPKLPGIIVRGMTPGACRVTVRPASGEEPRRYMIVVRPPGVQPRGASDTGIFTSSSVWEAGSASDQPRYDQRSDLKIWCDAVGCGPCMLAMMVAWAEHNQNVPSIYWNRSPNISLATRKQSLRDVDSPMSYVEGSPSGSMRHLYQWFHGQCHVFCWCNGAGSTMPWDAGNALGNYVNYACSDLMPLFEGGDPGGRLVGGNWLWENDGWGDDWDEVGVKVANAIKAGRPGGVYYMEHWHYCVAWRYRKNVTQVKVNGQVIKSWTERLFRVNTGWGNQDRVWNAYDIDGCYLMNVWQKRTLP